MLSVMQVVIVGATGFIGRNLRRYLSENNDIRLVSIARHDFRQLGNETKIISNFFDDQTTLLRSIKNSDALIHVVGIGKQSVRIGYETVNVGFTKYVVDLCKKAGINKLVYASGLGVSAKTSMGYFISKYKAEQHIINSGLNYTIFRPSHIVGMDDLLTKYLKKQIKNGEIEIPGSGTYSIQPIYINDVVKVFLQSIVQPKFKDKILDLVGSDHITFEEYVRLFSKGTGSSIRKIGLEEAYHKAIVDSKSIFGVDDLNLLIGNFTGDHKKLSRITGMEFQSVVKLLESGSLLL